MALAPLNAYADSASLDAGGRTVTARPAEAGSQSLLAGLYRDGEETAESIVLRLDGDTALVSLASFADALDLALEAREGGVSLTTPAGRGDIPDALIALVDGERYVAIDRLAERLGISLRFDSAEYAVFADTQWAAYGRAASRAAPTDEAIDFEAPAATLSQWRTEYDLARRDGDVTGYSQTHLAGGLGAGQWQLDVYDSDGAEPTVQNAAWLTTRGDTRWLVGQQQLSLHPLLPAFELAGVQYARTNAADTLYDQYTADLTLVPNRSSAASLVRGEGPPGGVAELRVNGRAIEQRAIGLDGRYEFRNVPAAPGDAIRIEVAVYEFGELGTPVRIDESYSQAGDLQLAPGSFVHFAGVGANDNLFDDRVQNGGGAAGFYQFRYGVSSRATLDALVQSIDGDTRLVAGTALNLGRYGSWAAYAGGGGERDALGWQVQGDGQWRDWFWRANAIDRNDGYFGAESPAFRTLYGEFGRRIGERLRVSLIGYRSQDGLVTEPLDFDGDGQPDIVDTGDTISYVKPAVDWRPLDNLSLNARPSAEGDYTYSASWYPRPTLRFSATSYAERDQLDIEQQLGRGYRVAGSVLHDDRYGERGSLSLTRFPLGSRRFYWSVGALASNDAAGYIAEAGLELVPGLSMRLQAYDDPLFDGQDGLGGEVINLSLIADFALGAGGLARGDGLRLDARDLGGLVGGIVGDLPGDLEHGALANIGVLVDGRVVGYTDAGGRYYIAELPPGVHTVQLDSEALPIELVPTDRTRRAEVRAGRSTRVDFAVALRLGLAGKIVDASGEPRAGVTVTAQRIDVARDGDADRAGDRDSRASADSSADTSTDTRMATATSSAFGFYRLDDLPPGTYALVARDGAGRTVAGRTVKIIDRFLFGIALNARENTK